MLKSIKYFFIFTIIFQALAFSASSVAQKYYATPTATTNYRTATIIIDGVSGMITANDIVDKSFCAVGYYVTYNTTAFVPTQLYTTYNVGIIPGEIFDGATVSTNGIITVTHGGYYHVDYGGSLDKENDTDNIEMGGSINGADPDPRGEIRLDSTQAGFNTFSKSGALRLPANAVLCFKIKNITSNTRSITLRSFNLSVQKLAN